MSDGINPKLLAYAERFLASREYSSMAEHAAAFADQLRAGCLQDLQRLLDHAVADTPAHCDGKTALRIFGAAICEGGGIQAWGLPDCDCNKPDCVYCARGLAVKPRRGR